jgi:DcaP outer membrane protein
MTAGYVNQKFVGYGGGLSGNVKLGWFDWSKDDFQWQFTIGNAIGRYLTNATGGDLATNYLVTPTSPAAAASVLVSPIMMAGGTAGYQHWWLPNLRSSLAYGYWQANVSSQLVGPIESTVANSRLQAVNFNVIWTPVAFVDTGVEYMRGQRRAVANVNGQEQVLMGEFRVKLMISDPHGDTREQKARSTGTPVNPPTGRARRLTPRQIAEPAARSHAGCLPRARLISGTRRYV